MDIRKVKKLIELLESSDIAEIEIKEGEESVRISRGSTSIPAPVAYQAPAPAPAPAPSAAEAPVAAAPARAAESGERPAFVVLSKHRKGRSAGGFPLPGIGFCSLS